MPGPSNVSLGSVANSFVLQFTVVAGSALTASTTTARTYTVPGLLVGDVVTVNKPTTTAGVCIANVRVSAADTLEVAFGNLTAGTPSLPATEQYLLQVDRHSFPSTAQIATGIA